MARALINSPRLLRTGKPLTLEAIAQAAPAVFAEQAHSSRGPRYAYVPTIRPLELMLKAGWGVYEVGQQRSRQSDKDPYTKHMLRMRKLDHFYDDAPSDHIIRTDIPEVILINAHDGSAAYTLRAGIFRFVCSNGLMVGRTMGHFTVRHSVSSKTSMEVLEAGERTITEKFPAMLAQTERLKELVLQEDGIYHLANTALTLRYGPTLAPFPAKDLLTVRRTEDEGNSAWAVMNRIQENIVDGGWETRSTMHARRSAVRPVERVSALAKINGGLWDAAVALLPV